MTNLTNDEIKLLSDLGLKKNQFNDEVVLVTGGARGIGKMIVKFLTSLGAKVILTDISEVGKVIVDKINSEGGDAFFVHTDLSELASIDNLLLESFKKFGRIDVILSSAARLKVGSVIDIPMDAWDDSYFTNLRAPAYLIKKTLPAMLERKHGVFLPLISLEGLPYMANYSAQKMGLRSMIISLGREIPIESGVHCIGLVPGSVDTPLIHELVEAIASNLKVSPDLIMDSLKNNPGYPGLVPPEHTAAACLYFLANAKKFHGQFVDGYLPLHENGIINIETNKINSPDNPQYPNPELELKKLVNTNVELEKRIRERTLELNKTLLNIEQDLNMAKKIQENSIDAKLNLIKELKIESFYLPMSKVGGDFYTISKLNENTYRFFLADATGHGVQAAMMTMAIKGIYDSLKFFEMSPSNILEIFNNEFLTRYLSLNSYLTCILVDIDIQNKKIQYSSAGHPPCVLVNKNGIQLMEKTGKLIGIIKNLNYKTIELDFEIGDRLFLFTDGLFEEFNNKNEEFGEEKLYSIFEKKSNNQILSVMEDALSSLDEFLGSNVKQDDITFLGIEYSE